MKIRFNLLPENQKKHLRVQKVLRTVMEQEIYIVIIVGILILSLFAMYFLLNTEALIMKGVETQIMAQSGYSEIADIHKKFTDVHAMMNHVSALEKKNIEWSHFFILLSEKLDEDITVNSLTVKEGGITMQALAGTRENVVDLKERFRDTEVNGEKCFQDIVVPESDLAKPINVTFTMTFKINLACL